MSIKSHGIMNDSQFNNVVIQLTDYLFERGHTINRPLIMDAAGFVRMYAESWYEQGKMTVTTAASPKPIDFNEHRKNAKGNLND